jgi:hypothetical protein
MTADDAPVGIRIEHLSNTNLEPYGYSNLLSRPKSVWQEVQKCMTQNYNS